MHFNTATKITIAMIHAPQILMGFATMILAMGSRRTRKARFSPDRDLVSATGNLFQRKTVIGRAYLYRKKLAKVGVVLASTFEVSISLGHSKHLWHCAHQQ
jgi:hypothetical protein